jgi:transposase
VIDHGSDGASALFDMLGFVVGAHMIDGGEWWLLLETTAEVVGCASCGVRAQGHGRRRVQVRETHDQIAPRAVLTRRARAEICRRVGQAGDSVAAVAREFGIGWHTAMGAVIEHGTPLIDDPDRLGAPSALGLDETSFLRASPTHPRQLVTGLVDLDRHLLLDVVAGRSGPVVRDWLDQRAQDWVRGIDVAVIDPFRGYATALADRLREATIVVDHFHAIRLANATIDDVRRRVQNETLGHRGRSDDPLYRIRRRLLVGHERLGDDQHERLLAWLERGDPAGEVTLAYLAKELLRDVYDASSLRSARARLRRFYTHCHDSGVPECRRLARTIRSWEAEVLAYHTTGCSNGVTEAINLLIKKIKRVGHGFRKLHNYRLRLLLHCGVWQPRTVARVRGRQPRFIA